jgi:23S rRNA pseudouridine1911/1915/1917 synthase
MSFQAGDNWTCGPEEAGARLDKFLGARAPEVSRSRIQKWLEEGRFALNGKPVRKSAALAAGDVVTVVSSAEVEAVRLVPEDIPLNVVYEDAQVLVVDKPKGMVTHPGNGIFSGTLANALAFRFGKLSDVNGPLRPGILHRLDKDTSGLLVVAKDNVSHLNLAKQMDARDIRRVYHALVWRELDDPEGTIDAPIARSLNDRLKMAVNPEGKHAVTHYKVLGFFQFASHLEVTLDTGRTHQIRVHFSHSGFPVVGDPLYGGRQGFLGRVQPILHPYAAKLLSFFQSQALHAHRLSFLHPVTGKRLEFTSPLPADMREGLAFLEKFRHG